MAFLFGHLMIALKSVEKGLGKLVPNEENIARDLENNWAVVSEAIQTILRREGFEHPYETLRKFSRGNRALNKESMNEFVEQLDVNEKVKSEFRGSPPLIIQVNILALNSKIIQSKLFLLMDIF